MRKIPQYSEFGVLMITLLLISACGRTDLPNSPTAAATNTSIPPSPPETFTTEIVLSDTPAPTPTDPPRTLVLCIGAEPESLYIYQSSMLVQEHVLNAIYDGPIDMISYEPRPVILEKIPSLAEGDARIEQVSVEAGDRVVNAAGEPVLLAAGERVRPSGCRTTDCVIGYTQGEVEMDQLSVDFTLLADLLWSDGEPLTAADSVYSFDLARQTVEISPYFGYRLRVFSVERTAAYEALDPKTVRWTGLPGFLDPDYRVNFWSPLPQHIWGAFTPEALLNSEEALRFPLGWGPYIIDDYQIGSHISLSKNPHYFRAAEGLPAFDHLVFRFVDENSTRNIARLVNGECDVVDQDAQLDDRLSDLIELERGGFLQLGITPGPVFEHLDFGLQPFSYDDGYQPGRDRADFLGDLRVRQALLQCLDRNAINLALYGGKSEIFTSYVSSSHPLFNKDAPNLPFSLKAGKENLTAVGWLDEDDDESTPRIARDVAGIPEGTPFIINLLTTNANSRRTTAEIIQASLGECGVQVETQFWEPGLFFADGPEGPVFGRQFDTALFAWLTGERPPCDFWITSQIPGEANGWQGTNAGGYSNAAFDTACTAAQSSLQGEADYSAAHLLAQQIFMQELPSIPLAARVKIVGAGPEICGLVMDPSANSEMWNLEEFNRGEKCP